MAEYFCTNCGAILNEQPGFNPEKGTWICTECGMLLMDEETYEGELLEGIAWYCDSCGTLLNNQPGFSDVSGVWCCQNCGFRNGVTEHDIINEDISTIFPLS